MRGAAFNCVFLGSSGSFRYLRDSGSPAMFARKKRTSVLVLSTNLSCKLDTMHSKSRACGLSSKLYQGHEGMRPLRAPIIPPASGLSRPCLWTWIPLFSTPSGCNIPVGTENATLENECGSNLTEGIISHPLLGDYRDVTREIPPIPCKHGLQSSDSHRSGYT